jgi:hypothetical protein
VGGADGDFNASLLPGDMPLVMHTRTHGSELRGAVGGGGGGAPGVSSGGNGLGAIGNTISKVLYIVILFFTINFFFHWQHNLKVIYIVNFSNFIEYMY